MRLINRMKFFLSSGGRIHRGWLAGFLALLLFAGTSQAATPSALPAQTDVERAEHQFDAQGVPLLQIEGSGKQRHPAWIALYALAYAGVDAYEASMENLKDKDKFLAAVQWLSTNLKQRHDGLWVWEYGFDSTYNDISIEAPWSSAFAQATGIQALLAAWRADPRSEYLDLAVKASKALFVPLSEGGFLYKRGDHIWFEEIPEPQANPGHILNGHMRTLLAIKELADATGDAEIANWFRRGVDTLYHWLPRYDAGYWLRYDLNPQKKDILFRLANPYGYANYPLAVSTIMLRDPLSKRESVIDVGRQGDFEGANRIAGVDWGQPENIAGRTFRRILSTEPQTDLGVMGAPHSYFYLSLPDEWRENLRDQSLELIVEYYDESPANVAIQKRSIAPGQFFQDMRDGDLLLSGSGQWRRWIVPIRISDLGFWVGKSYAEKHAKYLAKLARLDSRFESWVKVAVGYLNILSGTFLGEVVKPGPMILPRQTPMVLFSLDDKSGLLLQHPALPDTELVNGFPAMVFDEKLGNKLKSPVGEGVVNPQGVADQLAKGRNYWPDESKSIYGTINYPYGYRFDPDRLERRPAYDWLSDPKNQITGSASGVNFLVWPAYFDNSYNDITSRAPWSSAYTQALIVKAFFSEGMKIAGSQAKNLGVLGINAFGVDVKDGGLSTVRGGGEIFFQEVPNKTHVLNAHLLTVNELNSIGRNFNLGFASFLSKKGVESLKKNLYKFDTGYWMRYDLNPKKEILIQLDWLAGKGSPLIYEILFQNPQTGRFVKVDVGGKGAFDGGDRISGSEWQVSSSIGVRNARGFINGYDKHAQSVPGGTRHNVYLLLMLPDREFFDYFDVPPHRLVIRYKDTNPGKFAVKVQSVSEASHLAFVPLRNGIWQTTGDQQLKEAVFLVRPQDMGWYKGSDYQVFEKDLLLKISDFTGDWFFRQYAERQGFFLEQQKRGRQVIVELPRERSVPPPKLTFRFGTPTYAGHDFTNALDGDPDNDYVAGIENEVEARVDFSLDPKYNPTELRITWENKMNFARKIKVYGISDSGGEGVLIGESHSDSAPVTRIALNAKKEFGAVRVIFSDFSGQDRLLLRLLEIH